MKRIAGFTLVELMVTIAVFIILVSVGTPGLINLVRDNRVATQTNELISALNFARAEAVKRGGRVQVVVSQTETGWSAAIAVAGDAENPLRVVDRPGSPVVVNAATVVFTPTGAPLGVATFNMQPKADCHGTQRRQIALLASGQITTTRQACS